MIDSKNIFLPFYFLFITVQSLFGISTAKEAPDIFNTNFVHSGSMFCFSGRSSSVPTQKEPGVADSPEQMWLPVPSGDSDSVFRLYLMMIMRCMYYIVQYVTLKK